MHCHLHVLLLMDELLVPYSQHVTHKSNSFSRKCFPKMKRGIAVYLKEQFKGKEEEAAGEGDTRRSLH